MGLHPPSLLCRGAACRLGFQLTVLMVGCKRVEGMMKVEGWGRDCAIGHCNRKGLPLVRG